MTSPNPTPIWCPEDVWFKDPGDVSWFTFSWLPFLGIGETITDASMSCDSMLTRADQKNTTTTSSIQVSGGVDCTESIITMQIDTSAGNTYTAQKIIYIKTRWE